MTLAAEIWTTLSKINVNENIEKKGNLSYLSWTWAWSKLMEHFPDSYYHFEDRKLENGTVEVTCILSIHKGDQSVSRHMWLPVMDHKNNSIINPSSRMISDAKMRCLVKAIGIMGLGLYVYAGEDLPAAEKERMRVEMQNAVVSEEEAKELNKLISETETDVDKFCEHYKIAAIELLPALQYEQAIKMLQTKKKQKESHENV
jgi:hypothetical protein